MALRSIWNGTITFGMVNVPIKLYSATTSRTVSFRQVHVTDGCRIEHRRMCPTDEEVVPTDEVVKGYDTGDGRYVVMGKDEIKAAAGDRGKVVHLTEFVDAAAIDPVFFEKTYFLGSRDDEDAYRLVHAALHRSGRAGLGYFTFHNREYLAAVRALDDHVLGLHTMRFHDELVDLTTLAPAEPSRAPSKKEIDMAGQLVGALDTDFAPEEYEDHHREAVLALIARKAQGEDIDLVSDEPAPRSDDLLAALEASLAAGSGDAKPRKKRAKAADTAAAAKPPGAKKKAPAKKKSTAKAKD